MKMISGEGNSNITTLDVVSHDTPLASPCVLYLQVLAGFCLADTKVYLLDTQYPEKGKGTIVVYNFSDILPHPFILKNQCSQLKE